MSMPRTTFTLQLTERCNLACSYCYVRARASVEPDCTPEGCRAFVDFALGEPANETVIAFFGGEPLLRPDLIRDTVAYGKRAAAGVGKAVRFHLVTNGTLLDDEMGDFIAREGIGLEVSIDGPQEIHDAHRPRPDGSGSFAAVYGNLRRFHARHPEHAIRIFSVITSPDALPWLHELLRELGTTAFTFNEVTLPDGLEEECAGLAAAAGPALAAKIARHRERFLRGDTRADEGVNRQLASFLKGDAAQGCGAGVTAAIVTQGGGIYPCPFFVGHEDQAIGDLAAGLYPEKVRLYRERTVDAPEACRHCSLHAFCGGGCAFRAYRRSGSIRTVCPDSCRTTRESAAELERSVIALAAEEPELLCRTLDLASDDPCLHLPAETDAGGARNFIVRLTGACNLACDYCYDAKGEDRLDLPTARAIADHILKGPCREPLISLFGGEPLLNWETGRYLLETVAAGGERAGKRPRFHIATNGTLITEEIARTLARHDVTVQVSIDGTCCGHDAHRKFPDCTGSHAAVLEKLALLREIHPAARIDAQVVLTPGNMDMIAIAGELRRLGFRRINFLRSAWGERTAVSWTTDAVAELARARAAFFPFYIDAVLRGEPEIDLGFAALVAAEPAGNAGLCSCGTSEVYIDTKGDIYPCPQTYSPGERRLGSCAAAGPAPAPIPHTFDRIDGDCLGCWAFSRCRGGCAVLCQRCPLVPTTLSPEERKPWCDLMRAEFARAIIAHRLLERYHPESLAALRSIFGGVDRA